MTSSSIFQYIEKLINSILTNFDASLLTGHMATLTKVIALGLVLWIVYHGALVFLGKSAKLMEDFLKEAVIVVAIGIIIVDMTYIGMINTAIESLHLWASGGVSLWKQLDLMMSDIIAMGIIMEDTDGTFDMVGLFSQVLTWIGFTFVAFATVSVLLWTTLTLKFLLVLTPLMIASLVFGWFKNIFFSWVEMLLANTFVLLFVGLFFTMFGEKYKKFTTTQLKYAESASVDVWSIASEVFFVSIVMFIFISSSIIFATKLAKVSMDSEMRGAFKNWRNKR